MLVKGPATLHGPRGALQGEAVDLSSSGVCLTVPEPVPVGEVCSVDVHLEPEPLSDVTLVGRVSFCIEYGARFRVGLNCSSQSGRTYI